MRTFFDNIADVGVYFLECEEVVANTTGFIEALREFYFPADAASTERHDMGANLTQVQ